MVDGTYKTIVAAASAVNNVLDPTNPIIDVLKEKNTVALIADKDLTHEAIAAKCGITSADDLRTHVLAELSLKIDTNNKTIHIYREP